MQHTFSILKPDCVERELAGYVLWSLARSGLVPVRMNMQMIDRDFAAEHYIEHKDKPYFDSLLQSICAGPLVSLVLRTTQAVPLDLDASWVLRSAIGPYKQSDRIPGTIRGYLMRYGDPVTLNLIHGADSEAAAIREGELWYGKNWISPPTCS